MATNRKLPSAVTSRARKAATKYEREVRPNQAILDQADPTEREYLIRIMLAEWWDNGYREQDDRLTGSAESIWNQANEPGWPNIKTLNVVPAKGMPGNYTLYASRVS